jgi:signal-transduction protein with cAMP-binding, CBS, and nucleotidyltransferase domain
MYEIRSSYVHHALDKDFEIEDLRNLQVTVQALIGKLIEKSYNNKQKSEILKEIDDAILDAY